MKPNWFIALPVSAAGWFAPLIASAPAALRRFHPEELHLTLAFLGAVTAEQAHAAWAVAARLPPPGFDVTLDRLVPMGPRKRPSALAASLARGRDEVAAYMTAHSGPLLAAADARPDTRPARPHVTIGRPPRKAPPEERRAVLDWAEARPAIGAAARLEDLALYTWAQDRSLRQFQVVARR